MKRPKVLLLNLSGIGRRSTNKMASLSSSQDIKAYCVNGHHGTNISNIKISRHVLVCRYSLNVLAKFDGNR